jgi:hypothetical protein
MFVMRVVTRDAGGEAVAVAILPVPFIARVLVVPLFSDM